MQVMNFCGCKQSMLELTQCCRTTRTTAHFASWWQDLRGVSPKIVRMPFMMARDTADLPQHRPSRSLPFVLAILQKIPKHGHPGVPAPESAAFNAKSAARGWGGRQEITMCGRGDP